MINWILAHGKDLLEIVAMIVGIASIIVKVTPTLKDDNFFLPLVKFIGKFIALDKYGPDAVKRPS
jgi:hypothetical protein